MKPGMNKRAHRPVSKHSYRPTPAAHPSVRGVRWLPFASLAAVVLAGFLLVGVLVNFGTCTSSQTIVGSSPYVSPYTWAGLERTGDRWAYYEDGVLKSQVGVDVSDHQGAIDWPAVATDGIDFAFVRAGNRGYTEGGLSVDTRFIENVDGAQAAGLATGTYFFSQAVSIQEAQEEADLVLSHLAGRRLELPVVFDHEPVADASGRANNLDSATLTACARAFCDRIEAAGYQTMVYGNAGDMARYDQSALGKRLVWFAEYDAAAPSAQFDFAIWQYTNGGSVAGINTAVDLNLRMTDAL